MLRHAIYFLYFGAVLGNCMTIVKPGPKYPPTKGEVWPKPHYEKKEALYYTFDHAHFTVKKKNGNILCLICHEKISVCKEYNIKRHYFIKHASKYDEYQGQIRIDRVNSLKKKMIGQQAMFRISTENSETATKICFMIAEVNAKRSKPLSDGEFVKECLEMFASVACPEQKALVKNMSLSHQTIARRIDDMTKDIESSLKTQLKKCVFYSFALDESTDVSDTAQLTVLVRGVTEDYTVIEELLDLRSMKDTTTGKDFYEEVKSCIEKYELRIENLCGLTTDGAPAMTERTSGFVALMRKNITTTIIQLCGKVLELKHVMDKVVQTVNFIRARGLNHRQFQAFLSDVGSDHEDIMYLSRVRWLSRASTLKQFYSLLDEVKIFLENKGQEIDFVTDEQWLADLKIVEKETCEILTSAIERYIHILKNKNDLHERLRGIQCHDKQAPDELYEGKLYELVLSLTATCEEYPYFDMDESYNVTVSTTSLITSSTIWGMLRGLETFAQLFYLSNDRNELRVNKTVINDFPRYQHRGILLDTSRHFPTTSIILKLLDAMAINKMNVFHWHIVDDQSFPYQSEKIPELSGRGAYDSSMIYTKEDIEMIINYARHRGIRVIPEFDVPGHTASWGIAFPGVLTECYKEGEMVGLGPMNPVKNMTYKLLADLFQEVQDLFPDRYFHVGGDEVELECWRSNPQLQEYMKTNNLNVEDLHALFMKNIIPLLANNSKLIVWQDVLKGVLPSNDTLIQVWRNGELEMITILLLGYRMIFSTAWYLSELKMGWPDLYTQDPRQMVVDWTGSSSLAKGIVGGEACMWGEMVDDTNIISRVWPRASAVAECMWSSVPGSEWPSSVPRDAYNRIEEHACRMNRRGIDAQPPSGPGYCVV